MITVTQMNNRIMRAGLCLIAFLIHLPSIAQDAGSISGRMIDKNNLSIEFANVIISAKLIAQSCKWNDYRKNILMR
jgi:hypothetical protein